MATLQGLRYAAEHAGTVYLYGAGIIAYNVRCALRTLWQVDIAAHIVSDPQPGDAAFEGIPVRSVRGLPAHLPDAVVLVATPPEYQQEIAATLREQTDCPFFLLDSWLQFELMGAYYRQEHGFSLCRDLPRKERKAAHRLFEVCMARSAHDKPLRGNAALPPHVYPVQAGAALDDTHLPGILHDDDGENISHRNRDFSEMTVAYWAWKNRKAEWQGICHYRRVLGLSDADYQALAMGDADAVLPLPYLCAGDASFQYRRYISAGDMELLYSVLDHREQESLRRELAKPYVYNHNLLLARREVFADYCERVFSVLLRVEEAEGVRPWRNDRHMGYLAEILTSAYFTGRADSLHIVHAPELWLV